MPAEAEISALALTEVAQFGMAGLVAWMWLSERRAGAVRERQLTEAHERLVEQRAQTEALMTLVRENTRAVSAVEAGQRSLRDLLTDLLRLWGARGPAAGAGAGAGPGPTSGAGMSGEAGRAPAGRQ